MLKSVFIRFCVTTLILMVFGIVGDTYRTMLQPTMAIQQIDNPDLYITATNIAHFFETLGIMFWWIIAFILTAWTLKPLFKDCQ